MRDASSCLSIMNFVTIHVSLNYLLPFNACRMVQLEQITHLTQLSDCRRGESCHSVCEKKERLRNLSIELKSWQLKRFFQLFFSLFRVSSSGYVDFKRKIWEFGGLLRDNFLTLSLWGFFFFSFFVCEGNGYLIMIDVNGSWTFLFLHSFFFQCQHVRDAISKWT